MTMDAVVLNCVTQFNIVWRVGTFPFLLMLKCRRKTRCVTVAESLFLKNVSTANARRSSDQRCMILKALNRSTQRSVFHRAIYKDVGIALNVNSLIVSAPPYIYVNVPFSNNRFFMLILITTYKTLYLSVYYV